MDVIYFKFKSWSLNLGIRVIYVAVLELVAWGFLSFLSSVHGFRQSINKPEEQMLNWYISIVPIWPSSHLPYIADHHKSVGLLHTTLTFSEGRGLWKQYQTIGSNGNYHHAELDENCTKLSVLMVTHHAELDENSTKLLVLMVTITMPSLMKTVPNCRF